MFDSQVLLDDLNLEMRKMGAEESLVIVSFSPSGCSKDKSAGSTKAFNWTQELNLTRSQAIICLPNYVDDLVNLH